MGEGVEPGRGLDLHGLLLPVWGARVIAGVLVLGGLGLPWLGRWQGVLKGEAGAKREVQLRPELVELPGGVFWMGSPEGEKDRGTDEKRHRAEVGAFAICRTEVTLGQWEAVMKSRPNSSTFGDKDDHPVNYVSWEDALRYLNALTDRENEFLPEGKKLSRCYEVEKKIWDRKCTGYRLPTEAEWEYAARAGTERAYSFGEDEKELCKYGNVSKSTGCDDGFGYLAPVGTFKRNPWGLYDMHGNVWEWVWDRYGDYPESSALGYGGVNDNNNDNNNDNVTNNDKSDDGERRVLRGGSFDYGPRWLRSSVRDWLGPSFRNVYYGFRCVRGLPPSLDPLTP